MKKIALICIVLCLALFIGCQPYQNGPSFEQTVPGTGWDFGEKFITGARFTASPLIVEDRILIPSLDGKIYVLDAKMGKKYFMLEKDKELFFNAKGRRVFMNSKGKEQEPYDFMFRIPQGIRSKPAYRDGIIYFGTFDKNIHGIDLLTGQERFTFTTDDYISASPLIDNNLLFIGGYDGIFRAIDLTKSQQTWTFESGNPIKGGASSAKQGVVFANSAGKVFYLNKADGSKIAEFSVDAEIVSTPAVKDNIAIVVDRGGKITAFNLDTNSIHWQYKTELDGFAYPEEFWVNPTIDDDAVFIGSTWGKFYALKINPSGNEPELLWKPFQTKSAFGSSDYIMCEATVFVEEVKGKDELPGVLETIDSNPQETAIDTETTLSAPPEASAVTKQESGEEVSPETIPVNAVTGDNTGEVNPPAEISSVRAKVFFGCNDGILYCLDRDTGKEIWKFHTLGEVRSKPLIIGDKVVFASNDHYFYGLDIKSGQPVRGRLNEQ
jgi:outer membrane protein assembly factor BamB